MYHLGKAAASAVAVLLAAVSMTAHAEGDITVKLDSLCGKAPEIVSFEKCAPIQCNSVTLAPARELAEAAGMTIDWNQPSQTATVTLKTDSSSDKPIEVYASQIIGKVGGYGLDLTPVSITAALKLNESTATLRYNFSDTDGDTVSIGKQSELSGSATLVDDGTLLVPVRGVSELFGLDVAWNQDDLSMKISIPDAENITVPNGLGIISSSDDEYCAVQTTVSETVAEDAPVSNDPQKGRYLGRFKITHYAPGYADNGIWGNATAWAGEIIPGQTIGVDPNVIPKLSWVYIDGYGLRRAEDCGSAVRGNIIDVAVASVAEANRLGVVYKDVYMIE